MSFHVDSEVGQLRQVILHRPDLELNRLTPTNKRRPALRRRHVGRRGPSRSTTASPSRCASTGCRCTYFDDLLREALDDPEARELVLDRVFDETRLRPAAIEPLRDARRQARRPTTLAELPDRRDDQARARWTGMPEPSLGDVPRLDDDDFLLAPLPNHLFKRDNSAWIYDGVSINPMRKPARKRETIHSEAIYNFHPMFARRRTSTSGRQGHGRRPGHHRGRRRPRHRQRRGADRHGRAHHAAGASRRSPGGCSPPARRTRIVALDLPQDAGVHAPRHGDDDGRRGHVHAVRRPRDAPVVHDRARRRRGAS